ncbi:MAG: DUF4852 domain-containing protein [Pseudomonadota bacterium]
MTKVFRAFFVLILLITANTVMAQSQPTMKAAPTVKNSTTLTYAPTSFENNIKLAWAMGAYDPKDVTAVNRFLEVTECNLYKKFFQNEFEWAKILKNTQKYLSNYGESVPRSYQFVQPISLKRYDFNLKGFPLEANSVYDPTYIIQISDDKHETNVCGTRFVPEKKFPNSAILSIPSPFALSFLHVPEDIAKEYVSFLSSQKNLRSEERPAFMRFQIEISRLLRMDTIGNTPYFVFRGKLIRIDAFADKELLLPLYTQKF